MTGVTHLPRDPQRPAPRARGGSGDGDAVGVLLRMQATAGNGAVTAAIGGLDGAARPPLQRVFTWGGAAEGKQELQSIDFDKDPLAQPKDGVPKVSANGKFTPGFLKWAGQQLGIPEKVVGTVLDDARKSGTVHVLGEPGQVATALLAWLHRQNLVAPAQVAPAVNKAVEHLPMKTFTALDLGGRISVIDKLSQVSDYEKAVAARPKSGKIVTLFRYHKFRADDAAQQRLVLGGGLNKAEITQDWADKAVLGFLRTRQALLKQLAVATGEQRASLMQDFQANALSTPFIATTSDEGYARSLFAEYPPESNQRAVLLVIQGPLESAFDFEAEFGSLPPGVGHKEYAGRLEQGRKKDAEQSEFGIADPYLVVGQTSPLGFRIVDVIACVSPPPPPPGELAVTGPGVGGVPREGVDQ